MTESDKRAQEPDEQADGVVYQQTERDGEQPIAPLPVNTSESLGKTTEEKSTEVHERALPSEPSTPTDTDSWSNRKKSSNQGSGLWTMTHSFYAMMGGFEFINTTESTITSMRSKDGRIVSPEGLLSLKREGRMHSPPVDRKDIEDKSKVSYATKAFILFQGT